MSRKTIALTMLLFGLLAGCALRATTPTQKSGEALITQAAQTVAVMLTDTATHMPTLPPTWTPTPIPTEKPAATRTPTPPATVTGTAALPTNVITKTKVLPCDLAQFLADATIPDGTAMLGGTRFTKTWEIRNAGSCTWDSTYQLVFVSGSLMGGPATGKLTTGTVAPGERIDISVQLQAPTGSGLHTGYWMLRNGNGANFGIDTRGSAFYVRILVDNSNATRTPTPSPTPTP